MFILAIVVFQLLVDVTIVVDIPFFRQILGFAYFTLIPGMVLIRIVGMNDLDRLEKILFSIGLSVSFVMFLGLVVNQSGLLFPSLVSLSTPTLLLATNFAVLFLCILCYFFNQNMLWDKSKLNFSLSWVLLLCLPALAILGTAIANFDGNNVVLLVMIATAALTILVASTRSRINSPLVLFMISIALLFHTSLISNYIVGFDIHRAYHVFEITHSTGIWNPIINETGPYAPRMNQMLSATVFPTIYSNILNLEGTWVFKIVYPVIFALVPVGLFQLYQKYVGKKAAVLAAFFILADITFSAEMPGLPTQMIAEFFLVLLLIVIFHEKLNPPKKVVLLTIFGAGMVVSHYGTSYVLVFILLIGWSILLLTKKPMKIKSTYVILLFALAFSWYIYTSQSASFATLLDMGQNIYNSFWIDFLNPTEEVLSGVGIGESAVSIGHWLGRGFHYITQFFMVLGVTVVLLKLRKGYQFDREYVTMSTLMLAFIISPLVLPSFNLLNITRMYHMSLLFLAPFCIVGGNFLFSFLPRLPKSYMPSILTLIVITSLFLFETGFVYEVSGDVSYSVPLSLYRMNRTLVYGRGYLAESADVAGVQWLHSNVILNPEMPTTIYADSVSIYCRLISYGRLSSDYTDILFNGTYFDSTDVYVYLRRFNTFDGKIALMEGQWLNTSDLDPRLEALDEIYTNGGSEVFATPETHP